MRALRKNAHLPISRRGALQLARQPKVRELENDVAETVLPVERVLAQQNVARLEVAVNYGHAIRQRVLVQVLHAVGHLQGPPDQNEGREAEFAYAQQATE